MPKLFCKPEEKRTKDCFQSECDINVLMRKYQKSGRLPNYIKQNPVFGDFSKSSDLMSAMQIVEKASLQFKLLDIDLRKKFNHDPLEFLRFVEDPANVQEMIDLGLAVAKPVEVKSVSGTESVKS